MNNFTQSEQRLNSETSAKIIFTLDKTTLAFYPNSLDKMHSQCVFICYSLVNRPSILDLTPERSLIGKLNQLGISVYLLDWGYPEMSDAYLDLDDYIFYYLHQNIIAALQHANLQKIHLMGVCQGGVMSLCYATQNQHLLDSLINLVTPYDFHTPDFTLSSLVRKINVREWVSQQGNVPGPLLNCFFKGLKPQHSYWNSLNQLATLHGQNPKQQSMRLLDQWINDCPDQAGAAFLEFHDNFFVHNKLLSDELVIGTHSIQVSQMTQPLFNIIASNDPLIPHSATQALRLHMTGKNYQELEIISGHIGLFIRKDRLLAEALAEWIKKHTRQLKP